MWIVGDRDEDNGYKNVSCLVLFRLSRLRTRDGGSNVGSFVSSCLWTVRLSGSEETVRVVVFRGQFASRGPVCDDDEDSLLVREREYCLVEGFVSVSGRS